AAARAADRLLGVDLSYRGLAGAARIAELVRRGDLGRIFAVDLTFHNAYGPDKPWFYDPAQSGGGCVADLGVHLVDLALWIVGGAASGPFSATLRHRGTALTPGVVEDHAIAEFVLDTGATVRLACSWHLDAGRDAVIEAAFYGTAGAAALKNVGGSFYDFIAERFAGTATEVLAAPPDDWSGRIAAGWAVRLAAGARFDPAASDLIAVAHVLDRIYAAAGR
ncbi:Gfo/Idh/MocA family protein, partial [Sphingomonas bacterium]|uniref:Gfo/Idh/MocA family protein n=1 Tax=Sphingomonas bacterium TaxID=1895847 RepID=UPI001576245D